MILAARQSSRIIPVPRFYPRFARRSLAGARLVKSARCVFIAALLFPPEHPRELEGNGIDRIIRADG